MAPASAFFIAVIDFSSTVVWRPEISPVIESISACLLASSFFAFCTSSHEGYFASSATAGVMPREAVTAVTANAAETVSGRRPFQARSRGAGVKLRAVV
ncbi:hypothetical protein [Rathayibacter tanaceti]|uniref:hypothetical protein n=1 Tax=Rathayibacter tanaceti TaxID=1671680 RepID=UPI00082C03DA|nr:hypothetical protein [Rathayibacter tanaceti]